MSSERWGAFSVKDHIDAAALAADVLLYDRLVLPVPANQAEEKTWENNQWQPEVQKSRLDVLGELVERVAWNEDRRRMYAAEMEKLTAAGVKVNGYQLTSAMLAKELDVVAAYQSGEAFRADYPEAPDSEKQAYLAYLLGQRFAVPKGDPVEALKKAVAVAKTPEFKEHRLAMYDWQLAIIEKHIPPADAVAKMEEMLAKYNACVEKAVKDVYYKFGYTIAGIALTLAGAPANLFVAGGALLATARFSTFDTKPVISAGPNGPAAMFHDFENVQKPFWDWTKHV